MTSNHIFLTGGTGFFGKALLRYWLRQDQKGKKVPLVTLLSRNPNRFEAQNPELAAPQWLRLIQGDVCDPNSLPRDLTFSHLLHAAADSTNGPHLMPMERYDQIVNGTRNALDLAVASGASRFLLTSSGGVYGSQPPDMEQIPEEFSGMPDPLNPDNSYSVAKRGAEHLCALYRDRFGVETVIARCFAFAGQDLPLDVHFAIGNFVRDALYCKEISVQGSGTPLRTYLDQHDLANWLLTILENGRPGEAYNVGSDEVVSIAELAHLVRDLIAPEKPVRILGEVDLSHTRHRYIPSINKVRSEFGLDVTVPLAESIRRTAEMHRKVGLLQA